MCLLKAGSEWILGVAAIVLTLPAGLFAATGAHAGGMFLYEMATPDLGTASAGRAAAAADNAATAFGNSGGDPKCWSGRQPGTARG